MDEIVASLSQREALPKLEIIKSPKIVSVESNFDLLLFPRDAGVRTDHHTITVDENHVLISQASTAVAATIKANVPTNECVLLCACLVYRRSGVHHQVDIWRLDFGSGVDQHQAAVQLATGIIKDVLPMQSIRTETKDLPYIASAFKLVSEGESSQTLADGGQLHPLLVSNLGLDPEYCSGYALGFSLDRLTMRRKDITEEKLLRDSDKRVSCQMRDLSPYRAVSRQPSVRQDLSITIDEHDTLETVSNGVMIALGHERELVEDISMVSETSYESLPPHVRERLGVKPGQKNVLMRIVFCAFDRSLSQEEVNDHRNRIYAAIHKGTKGYI